MGSTLHQPQPLRLDMIVNEPIYDAEPPGSYAKGNALLSDCAISLRSLTAIHTRCADDQAVTT